MWWKKSCWSFFFLCKIADGQTEESGCLKQGNNKEWNVQEVKIKTSAMAKAYISASCAQLLNYGLVFVSDSILSIRALQIGR